MARAAAHWFTIRVADLERAIGFYETLLGATMHRGDMGGRRIAVFPYDEPTIGGNLVEGAPSEGGTVIYLNCDGQLDAAIARVAEAGGAVLMPRTELPDGMGSIAHVRDTEGNCVGLHSI